MFYGTKYINFQNNNKNPVKKVVVRRMGIHINRRSAVTLGNLCVYFNLF